MSGTVLDEVTSDSIDSRHVQRRVDDWEERVKNLYEKISDWLPDGWQARHGTHVRMHAELMRKFGVAAKQMPTLELFDQSGDIAKLRPHALWIIGYNGRIDFKHNGQHYFIVDFAENFERPDWQAIHAEKRSEHEEVTKEWLTRILQQAIFNISQDQPQTP